MTRTYNPSQKTIASRMSWLDEQQVKLVRGLIDGSLDPLIVSEQTLGWVTRCYNEPSEIEQIMHAIDSVMGTHGVEALYTGYDSNLQHPTAVYCNTGETYNATVVYCYKTDRFLITSWGDYYEKNGGLNSSDSE